MIRIALGLLLALAATAVAETRRVAVVIGNNTGSDAARALRYAELDADKLARVLVELGGVAPGDLFLLQGKDLATVEDTLKRAKARIAEYRGHADRVVAIFYYSGHSDGVALELGRQRLTYSELRFWLEATGADVRVAVIDSCKSGALLSAKGGVPGPAFRIRLSDELASQGEAFLTSSAADEDALESRQIEGSFFTHYLVSGLRGAADASGDGRVTLTEAYQYAYTHTTATSAATFEGPQHPTYDYRLKGEGELVLTELTSPTASLELPDDLDRALVVDLAHGRVIAEVGRGDPSRLALDPGRYAVRAWRGTSAFEGTFALAAHEHRAVAAAELALAPATATWAKGDVDTEPPPVPLELGLAVGLGSAVATPLDALGVLRAEVRIPALYGASFALDTGTRRLGGVRETSAFVFAGLRAARSFGRVRAALGVELGAGAIVQAVDGHSSTGAVAAAPLGELAIVVTPSWAIALQAHVPVAAAKVDDHVSLLVLPAAWLGVVITP